jgi:hypothetical protein
MGDTNAEYLLGDNVIDAILKVRYLGRQAFGETAGNLPKKDT